MTLTVNDWCEDRHALELWIAHSLIKNETTETFIAKKLIQSILNGLLNVMFAYDTGYKTFVNIFKME